VVQATVAAPSAAEAEVLAKSAVILGSTDGARLLERTACLFGLLVLENGQDDPAAGRQRNRETGRGMKYRGLDARTKPLRWGAVRARPGGYRGDHRAGLP